MQTTALYLRNCLMMLLAGVLSGHAATHRILETDDIDAEARVELRAEKGVNHGTAAVIWLNRVGAGSPGPSTDPGRFTLLQKRRTFSPHLLVIPVGSTVSFPNADPFFHNVFSLFNGKRFDLGLYEAGASKDVVFSREGVSYIFCNIHPEMSAVILSLSTPYFSLGETGRPLKLRIPEGDYALHVWVEGLPQPSLDQLTRRVHFGRGAPNSVTVDARTLPLESPGHLNKFGQPYEKDSKSTY